jgi:hypothetical protein
MLSLFSGRTIISVLASCINFLIALPLEPIKKAVSLSGIKIMDS